MPSDGPPVPRGLTLRPFRALRYSAATDLAASTSPPYDVIDEAHRSRLEQRSPHNVVRLILPREPGGAAAADTGTRYDAAGALLAAWEREQVLVRDAEPALYVYEQTDGGHVQRGLLGAVGLARPEDGIILPHENTMAGPVGDRLALLRATRTNLEPIFLISTGGGAGSELLGRVADSPPIVEGTAADGTGTRLWSVTDPEVLAAVAEDLSPRRATIADGHHRYATYLRYQEERHEAGDGNGPWDYGLALLVDAQTFGPAVSAIHRVVPGLPLPVARQHAERAFRVREIAADSDVQAVLEAAGAAGPAFVVTDGQDAVLLTDPAPDALAAALPDGHSAAWRNLDVTIAHMLLIRTLWNLDDREGVVDFAHDVADALAAARDGSGVALLLNPTPVSAVAAVAEAGERMPRKSTLFTPKPVSGLVLRPLDRPVPGH